MSDRTCHYPIATIWAELHQALGEVERARQYCQQALALATELGIPLAAECRKLQEELASDSKEKQM